jgi:hypothetical protein
MRLEPGVAAGFVDFDHEVAVIVIRQRRQDSGEIDHAESWLTPEALGCCQLLVRPWFLTLAVQVIRKDVLDV